MCENCEFHVLVDKSFAPSASLRLLVHPMGNVCEEHGTIFESFPNLNQCDGIKEKLAACGDGQIFDWGEERCKDICPQTHSWSHGFCRHLSDSDNCLSTIDDIHSLHIQLKLNHTTADVTYSNSTISIHSTQNGTILACVTCQWISINGTVNEMGSQPDLVTLDGTVYPWPMYQRSENGGYEVCTDNSNSDDCPNYVTEHEELSSLYHSLPTKVNYTADGIRVAHNETVYCFNVCKWETMPSNAVVDYNNQSIWTHQSGMLKEHRKPFYFHDGTNHVKICETGLPSEGDELLGAICMAIGEEETSITVITLSMFFLIVTASIYIALPDLHNIPGLITMNQVCETSMCQTDIQ